MHLKKITLRNFRCFKRLEIKLHPRLTVLVAENGGGKTAVLDGIAIGLSPVLKYLSFAGQRLSGPGFSDTDFRIKSVAKNDRSILSDYTKADIETFSGLKWDNWRAGIKGKSPKRKTGQKELSTYCTSILESFNDEEPQLLPVFAYYGARRGWLPIPKRLRGSSIDYTQPVSALLKTLEPQNDFREMLNWFDIEEANELRANKGCDPEDYVPLESLEAVRAALVQILGETYKNPHFNKQHKFVVETQGDPGQMQVSQLSQGYQSMLALGMDFSRRMALANSHMSYDNTMDFPHVQWFMENFWEHDPESLIPDFQSVVNMAPAIMLVDEIDLHLHPSWQQRVLTDLIRAFPCTQFIVTTHSPQVLTTVPSECIRILEDGKIYSAPPGTEGAESSRVLKRVLKVDVRPPSSGATKELREYLDLVDQDQWDSPRAKELRVKLDNRYQGEEPALLDADLIIGNRKWELGQ